MTILALFLGILAHALKQIVTARRAGSFSGLKDYFLVSWPETALALVCSLAMYFAWPEVPTLMPAIAAGVGIGPDQTFIGAFLCGFVGNSLADLLAGRLQRIVGQ